MSMVNAQTPPIVSLVPNIVIKEFGLSPTVISSIIELFALCKGGNFNIHIWAWFGYFIC